MLCFSRDRPLQLDGYLRSLKTTCKGTFHLTVLFSCSDSKFGSAYQELESVHHDVEFVQEVNFKQQTRKLVNAAKSPTFMFGCDDVIFKRDWMLPSIIEIFKRVPRLIGFSLRLGSEITSFYSAQVMVGMAAPDFLETRPFLVWRWLGQARDWGYPWEMCCTIYPTRFVRDMIRALDSRPFTRPWKQRDWGHPNRLEAHGEDIISKFATSDLMASYPLARANTLTINRVQEVFENRVLNDISVHDLLNMWNNKAALNLDYYLDKSYETIEIGDFQTADRFHKA